MTNGVVLLVEDSSVIRAVVRRRLEEQEYRVIECEDGGAALSSFRECRPDVVLLDIEMPVLNGFQILELIKAEPEQADTPVVFLTASAKTEDLVDALRMGAHDYLRKPFEPSELMARVRAAVRVKSLQDELRVRNAELELMSRTDPLTGLWNRRHTEEQLESVDSLSRRHDTPFSVLMIDVDHFKHVNDSAGHTAGDAVLVEVAVRIREAVRIEDVVARWGGEEFLVVLPSTEIDGAWTLGDRIRMAVAAEPVVFTDGSIAVTVSVGCASSGANQTVDAIVSRADDALYVAKEGGRDRTERAS